MPKIKPHTNTEYSIYVEIAKYLSLKYPKVIWRFDTGAGTKLTIGQAVKQKKIQNGDAYPDLFIAEPKGRYHGLFIEIKKENTTVFLKNGEIASNTHLVEQSLCLGKLLNKGYYSTFAIGLKQCLDVIDKYMDL